MVWFLWPQTTDSRPISLGDLTVNGSSVASWRGAGSRAQRYLMVDPPTAGLDMTFANANGQPTLTLAGFGLKSYTFICVE